METVISLRLDRTSSPGKARWVVSRDHGDGAEVLFSHPRDDYEAAKSRALNRGKAGKLRVIELALDGSPRTLYDPTQGR